MEKGYRLMNFPPKIPQNLANEIRSSINQYVWVGVKNLGIQREIALQIRQCKGQSKNCRLALYKIIDFNVNMMYYVSL
jgi:hypothetical protein